MKSPNIRRLLSRTLIVGVAGAAVLTGVEQAASAYVSGLVRVTASSVNDSADSHTVTATCPAGTQLVGSGYEMFGALGDAIVDDLQPNGSTTAAPTAVTVVAFEAEANADNWRVDAYALCASVPGLVRVSATSALNSNDTHSATATCPAGKQLLGTGYQISGASGEAVVDDLRPNGDSNTAPTAVTVAAYEADSFSGDWEVTAYGICANPLPGLVRVSREGPSNSNDSHSTSRPCSAGKVLLGAGFEMASALGEAVVDDLFVSGAGNSTPASATAVAYEEDADSTNWTLTAYAICASSLALYGNTEPGHSDVNHFVTVECPANMYLTGGGFGVHGAPGVGVVSGFVPSVSGSVPISMSVFAHEARDHAGTWGLTVYGICSIPISGLERVFATSASNSNTSRTVTATCPTGKKLLSAGYGISASGTVIVDDLRPNGGTSTAPTAVTVSAYEAEPISDAWTVTAYGVCAGSVSGLVRVSASSTSSSPTSHNVVATCPAGKQMLGSGYEMIGSLGETVVNDLAPGPAPVPSSVTAIAYETDTYNSDWSLTAYAICAYA